MEVEGAVRLWKWPSQLSFHYVAFVGDGDSAACKAVCALNDGKGPYNIHVKKEECINHVSKRMGTRLRKIKRENVTAVQTKKGKTIMRSQLGGANKLTDALIDKLSSYYGMAIRNDVNTDEETMRRAVWASFLYSSDDRDSTHMLCPKGKESWCRWRVAQAEGKILEERKTPLLSGIPFEKCHLIKAVYADLASPELLRKYLKSRTQNLSPETNIQDFSEHNLPVRPPF